MEVMRSVYCIWYFLCNTGGANQYLYFFHVLPHLFFPRSTSLIFSSFYLAYFFFNLEHKQTLKSKTERSRSDEYSRKRSADHSGNFLVICFIVQPVEYCIRHCLILVCKLFNVAIIMSLLWAFVAITY